MREVLAELLLREVKDPRVAMVTVCHVDISPDLRQARVHVSCLGDAVRQQAALAGLASAAGFLRGQLSRRLQLRYAPELRFIIDQSFEHAARVAELLRNDKNPEDA